MKRLLFVLLSFIVFSSTQVIKAQEVTTTDSLKTELTQAEKDSIVYEKFNAEQAFELKKKEMEIEMQRINAKSKVNMPLNGFGIVMICLLPFLFVTTIIIIAARQKNTESKRKYDLYLKSLEMGQTIPEHFFDEPKQISKTSNVHKGIILVMVGISFGLFVIIKNNTSLPFLLAALIPTFVGAGYLIIHFLEKPKGNL